MTKGEASQVAQAFALTAAYYRIKIDDQVLRMYAEDVSDLPFDLVLKALGDYRRDPKNRQMPLPAQIRDMIEPQETPEAAARDLASKISGAIVKFGHPNENLARNYIGEKGWAIVQRWGGWSYLCANHGTVIDPGQFYAQIRDHAVDVVKYPHIVQPFPTALPPAQDRELLSGEVMPDGQPVREFENSRREQLKKLFEDMERRKREMT
jgi:hypothetical protein